MILGNKKRLKYLSDRVNFSPYTKLYNNARGAHRGHFNFLGYLAGRLKGDIEIHAQSIVFGDKSTDTTHAN